MSDDRRTNITRDEPATPEAEQWAGWGTALKPGWEPIIVARKPLDGTVAANVLQHGTGALNIDGCRIEGQPRATGTVNPHALSGDHGVYGSDSRTDRQQRYDANLPEGRWPANVVLDEDVAIEIGEVSRYFYCAKSSRSERNAGLDAPSTHPTVKPIALMRWLVRLVTPPGGVVLDPFMGSGSTGCAAVLEGFGFIGIDLDSEYLDIAERRIAFWRENGDKPIKAKVEQGAYPTPSLGKRKGRVCNVCGSRSGPKTPSGVWPSCGHDDWSWVPLIADTPRPTMLQPSLPLDGVAD